MTLEEAIIHCKEKACDNTQCALEHRQLAEWLKELQALRKNNNSIEERAKLAAWQIYEEIGLSKHSVDRVSEIIAEKIIEHKAIDIEKACNVFCHTGCPHKRDSYDCLNDKCDTWKTFRRMLEE